MGRRTLLNCGRHGLIWGLAALLVASSVGSFGSERESNARLKLIPIVSDQRIEDIQESPDGTRLLTHDRGYAPRLWDPKSMRLLAVLGGHPYYKIHQAEMSQDGSKIITVSLDLIRLWDAKNGRMLGEWPLNRDSKALFMRAKISPDGGWIVAGDQLGQVWYIDGKEGSKPTLMGKHNLPKASTEWVFRDIAISSDGTLAVTGGMSPSVMVWNIKEKKAQQTFPACSQGTGWLEISRDNKQVLETGFDDKARIWSIETGQKQYEWEHFVGDKGNSVNTMMGAIFVGKSFDEALVAGKTGTMTLYDRQSGKLVRKLEGYVRAIREIRKTRDGLRVATYADEDDLMGREPLKLWNVETTKEYPFTRGHHSPTAGAFSPDGRFFWVGYGDGSIRRHELETGKIYTETISAVDSFDGFYPLGTSGRYYYKRSGNKGLLRSINSTTFDPNSPGASTVYSLDGLFMDASPTGRLVIGKAFFKDKEDKEKEAQAVWNIASEKSTWVFWDGCEGLSWGGGEYVIAYGEKTAAVFDMAEPAFKETIYDGPTNVGLAKLSPDNKWAMVMDVDCKVHVIGIGDNKAKYELGTTGGIFSKQFVFTADSKHLVFPRDNSFVFLDLATGKETKKVSCPVDNDADKRPLSDDFIVTKDGSTLICAGYLHTSFVDLATGKERFRSRADVPIYSNSVESFLSPDQKYFAGQSERGVMIYEVSTGNIRAKLQMTDQVAGVCYSSDGKRLIVTDATEQATIWDATSLMPSTDPTSQPTLRRVGSFVVMRDGSWLAMDTDGRYDASDPSNVTGASYVLEWDGGLEPIDVQQLKSLFYEPGLLAKLLGTNSEPLRSVPNLSAIRLYPEVKLTRSERNPNRVEVALTERDGGGIGAVHVLINGKEVMTKDGVGFFSVNASDYTQYFLPAARLPEGRGNLLQVYATNKQGDLAGRAETVDLGIPEGLKTPDVHLYGLFVGVGDYVGNDKDLKAPPSDAEKLGEAVGRVAERLLPKRVHITELTTDTKEADGRPTRDSIIKWFDDVSKKATSSDIVVVFFAGHGTSIIGGQKGYFFLTADADPSAVTPSMVGTSTITGEDLQKRLASIPASKQVIILDTCHSGAAADRLLQSDRSVSSDFARAYESIKDGSGTWLLAGAAADQLSYESNNVDHGMLTYSLLEAIDRASADGLRSTPGGDLFLDVERWLAYAASRVDSLKNEVGIAGIQHPEFKRSKTGGSFDLGVLRPENRGEVGLKPPMPIVIMGTFEQDEEDPAGLENAIVGVMRDSGQVKLWTDVTKHPNVFRIAGTYTYDKEKKTIKLRLVVQKFDSQQVRKTIETFELEGSANSLKEFAQTVRTKVEECIRKSST